MTVRTRLILGLQILWRVVLFFVVFGVSGAVFIVPFASKLAHWETTFPIRTQLFAGAAGLVAIAAATWFMLRFVDRRPLLTIGFAPGHALRDLAVGLAVGTGWIAASIGVAWVTGMATARPLPAFSGTALVAAALFVLLNVLTQQLLLCGYVLQTIRSRAGFPTAVLVSAILFSAYHLGAFQGVWLPAVNVFAAGVLFCLAYGITGNLWFPTAIHFAWNFLLGPVLGLTVSGTGQLGLGWTAFDIKGPSLFTGGAFGLEGGLIVNMTAGLCLIGLLWVLRRQKLSVDPHTPEKS